MPIALFRADASPAIGGGHVMRCMTLARFLSDLGWRCVLATRSDTRHTVPLDGKAFAEVFEIVGGLHDEPNQLAGIGICDLLIADHYEWTSAIETPCRAFARRIMIIDDLANRPHDCDLLLDQTYGRVSDVYAGQVPGTAQLMLGSEYALLRPEFREFRAQALKTRRLGVQRVLISLGAGDSYGLTGTVLRAIGDTELDLSVDVVRGTAGGSRWGLEKIAAEIPQSVTFHGFDSSMARLMTEADLAIGAAGATSWERCCLGLPTLLIVTADNQAMVAAGLERAGAAKRLPSGSALPDQLVRSISHLNRDPAALAAMAKLALQVCDGLGCGRVAANIAGHRATDGRSVGLRLATRADSDIMYEWQCHPRTRQFARCSAVPTLDEHRRWLERKLAEPMAMLCIITHGDIRAGVLRLDPHHDGYEVSIYIAPGHHRLRLAHEALAIARMIIPRANLVAEILPENKASIGLFVGAGYEEERPGIYVNPGRGRATRTLAGASAL